MSFVSSLDELIAKSGESVLTGYYFSSALLTLSLELGDDDVDVQIAVKTHALRVSETVNNGHQLHHHCWLELKDVSKTLKVQNECYVPSTNFGVMMQEIRQGLSLAYGHRKNSNLHLFSVRSGVPLITCLIQSVNDVSWKFRHGSKRIEVSKKHLYN